MAQPAHKILTNKEHLPSLDKAPTGGGTNALSLLGHSHGVAPGNRRLRRHKPSLAVARL